MFVENLTAVNEKSGRISYLTYEKGGTNKVKTINLFLDSFMTEGPII